MQAPIPQTGLEVGLKELEKGLAPGSRQEEIWQREMESLVEEGFMAASAFVYWEGEDEDGKKKQDL